MSIKRNNPEKFLEAYILEIIISNSNEKPAQLFIGKTLEKPGLDTLIKNSSPDLFFVAIVFLRPPFLRLLLGDFNDKPLPIRYNTN